MSEIINQGDQNFVASTNLPAVRPGGELQGKPVQGTDGQWYDKFGEEVNAPLEHQRNQDLSLNTPLLKSISEKCNRQYPDKYVTGVFGKNVDLSEEETTEVGNLAQIAKQTLLKFTANEPLWPKFELLVEDYVKKFGGLRLDNVIMGDDDATDVTRELLDGLPIIRVPSKIKHLYLWEDKIKIVDDILAKLNSSDSAKGVNTKAFGQNIKELYRFVKESKEDKK